MPKVWEDMNDRIDSVLDQAERQAAGVQGQLFADALAVQTLIFDMRSHMIKQGHSVRQWDPLWQLPLNIFRPAPARMRRLQFVCDKGHSYRLTVGKYMKRAENGEHTCGHCSRLTKLGTSLDHIMAARVRLYMQHDERGENMHVESYDSAHVHHSYEDRVSGVEAVMLQPNVIKWSRPYDDAAPIVSIVSDGEYAFLWTGTRPVVENPFINSQLFGPADAGDSLVYGEPYYETENQRKKGYTHRKGLEGAILECVENGAKVLNISLNPQYKSPGVYEWGNLKEQDAALAEWIKGIEQEWDLTTAD